MALEAVGSNPIFHPILLIYFVVGLLAQLVEHRTFNPVVAGSSPA